MSDDIHLPDYPATSILMRVMPDDYRYGDVRGYTLQQLRDYARAAVLADRERRAQPAPGAEALLRQQRDAWRAVAEDQYAKLRTSLYGDSDSDYPVEGALDAYAAGKFPVLMVAAHSAGRGEV